MATVDGSSDARVQLGGEPETSPSNATVSRARPALLEARMTDEGERDRRSVHWENYLTTEAQE